MTTLLGTPKVTSKGQVTIPIAVREELGIGAGDRIMLIRTETGGIALSRYDQTMEALFRAQDAFAGAAKEAGLETIDDVVAMIKDLRAKGEI